MTSKLREEVNAVFGDTPGPDEKFLEECTSLCQIYDITPENLKYKWEALNYRPSTMRSEMSPFTMDSIMALKADIQRGLTKESAKRPQHRTIANTNVAMVNRLRIPPHMLKNVNSGQNAGGGQVKVEQSYGIPGPSTSTSAIIFRGPAMDLLSKKGRSYRYMYEKISERSEALDDRIDEFGEIVREYYKVSELADPSSSTDEEVTVIGRITHDSDSSDSVSKLKEATITLESSRMLASGARVPLRFDPDLKIRGGPQGVGGIGLFPGAIVALKGRNGGGGWFLVSEILTLPPLEPSPTKHTISNPKTDPDFVDTPFSICIACGPYTSDTDLSFKPWRTLLKNIIVIKPAVILLVGPFVDVQHPQIKDGDITSTPSTFFNSQIFKPLCTLLDSSPGSIALIIPSIRDLISTQAVFPQGELSSEVLGRDPRIHFLPNPCRFSVNDITFGVSSVDVIYHLKKEEFFARGTEVDPIPSSSLHDMGTDPMVNICRHLLQQRSFYPLFPVPSDVSHEVNLSVTHLEGLKLGGVGDTHAPDVLVIPSRLKHFSKTVHSTITLNPGFLTKGAFALVNVAAKSTEGGLEGRITTELVKLEV